MSDYCPSCMAENTDGVEKCARCGGDMGFQNRTHQLPVMTILEGRYMVGRVLGEGGFGITYIGLDLLLNERVAIKEFFPSGAAMRSVTHSLTVEPAGSAGAEYIEKERERFLEEARVMSRFKKMSNIVHVSDFFYANGTAYIIMEYIDGRTLHSRLKENGPERDFEKLYGQFRPLMESLDAVHKQGLIHRDISPSNLMEDKDGNIILLDFGTAREVSLDGEKSLSIVLKPGFAPEEQYRRHGKQGPWTDVYALCATMYKLSTGETPEVSIDRAENDSLVPPSKLGIKISPMQERVMLQGLAVKQEDRIQSIAELMAGFDGKGVSTNRRRAAGKKSGARKKLIFGAAAAAVAAAAIILLVPKMTVGDRGLEAYRQQDYANAEKNLLPAAERGSAEAQYYLGCIYRDGSAGTLDPVKAAEYFTLAAESGYAEAQRELGYCYASGSGTDQNTELAAKWFEQAAEQGDSMAQYELGAMYYYGSGVGQSYNTAVKWLELSAEQNNPEAQNLLGQCCENGYGTVQDQEKALEWYTSSAEQGCADAQYNLGRLYEQGTAVGMDYMSAARYYELAADKGSAPALNALGRCYELGMGEARSPSKAAELYGQAADMGCTEGEYNIGRCYNEGIGVEQNWTMSATWLTKAADKGYAPAQNLLGEAYLYGDGVEEDREKALNLFNAAAEQGSADAQYNLGSLCYGDKDFSEAFKWFKLAAEQDHFKAVYELGKLYEYGWGTEKDEAEAARMFNRSGELRMAAAESLWIIGNTEEWLSERKTAMFEIEASAYAGNADGQKNLGDCYRPGTGVKADTKKAMEWYLLAAEQNIAGAQNAIGEAYYQYGWSGEENPAEAVKWFSLAADQGNVEALDNLAHCYNLGYGVEQNQDEYIRLLTLSAEGGYSSAQFWLAGEYEYGNWVEQSDEEAMKWYTLAAESGSAVPQVTLGDCYFDGNCTEKDYTQALKWYSLAAAQNDSQAQYSIGECYENGFGVEKDLKRAAQWYALAANNGDENAKLALERVS